MPLLKTNVVPHSISLPVNLSPVNSQYCWSVFLALVICFFVYCVHFVICKSFGGEVGHWLQYFCLSAHLQNFRPQKHLSYHGLPSGRSSYGSDQVIPFLQTSQSADGSLTTGIYPNFVRTASSIFLNKRCRNLTIETKSPQAFPLKIISSQRRKGTFLRRLFA